MASAKSSSPADIDSMIKINSVNEGLLFLIGLYTDKCNDFQEYIEAALKVALWEVKFPELDPLYLEEKDNTSIARMIKRNITGLSAKIAIFHKKMMSDAEGLFGYTQIHEKLDIVRDSLKTKLANIECLGKAFSRTIEIICLELTTEAVTESALSQLTKLLKNLTILMK